MFFNKRIRNINRIQQIIKVLLRYGFEDIVTSTTLRKFVSVDWRREDRPILESTRWERIRMVLEDLGPTFVKLAQVLSNRPDLLPEPLIKEFQKLQDNVPPFKVDLAIKIVEEETGNKIEELFSFFDDSPLGSASIGQVHRARLKETGEDIVVKIQRPEAKAQVYTDLSLLKEFVKLTENFFKSNGILNPMDIVNTFEKAMQNELDYRIEAKNIAHFKKVYADDKRLYVPKPNIDITTDKVLVMEYVTGAKINDRDQLLSWGLNLEKVTESGLDIYLKQIFEMGYFHADPHPGNVLVQPSGKIVLIDFGMMGRLTKSQRYAFASFMVSISNKDPKGMALHLRRLATDSEVEDPRDLEQDMMELVEGMELYGEDEAVLNDMTGKLQKIIYKYQLMVPGSIFLILRSLTILEGVSKTLCPHFEMLPHLKPYGQKLIQEQFSFKNVGEELYYSFFQIASLLYNLPMELKAILKKARTGRLLFGIELKGQEIWLKRIDRWVTQFNLTFLSIGFLIASTLLALAPIPYEARTSWGIPYISIPGYAITFFLLFFLFFYRMRR